MGLPNAPSQGTVMERVLMQSSGALTLCNFTLRELQPTCQESEDQGSGLSLAGVSGSSQEGTFLRS